MDEDTHIRKAHAYIKCNNLHIVTIRHPYDSIASVLKCHSLPPEPYLVNAIVEYCHGGGNCIASCDIRKEPNTIVLRYEEFISNYDIIFDALEQHGIVDKIETTVRSFLKEKYDVRNVRNRLKALGDDFHNIDPSGTWFRGRHVSDTLGDSTYKTYFTPRQLDQLKSHPTLERILDLYYKKKIFTLT